MAVEIVGIVGLRSHVRCKSVRAVATLIGLLAPVGCGLCGKETVGPGAL